MGKLIKIPSEHRKILLGVIIPVGSLLYMLYIYLGISIYFINHFYFRTSINGISVSGKSVKNTHRKIENIIKAYELELEERGGKKEKISASDIGMKYIAKDKVKELKDSQNPLCWIKGLFSKEEYKLNEIYSFDENLLKKSIDNLACFKAENITEPKNPGFKYTGNKYEIVKEVEGNKVIKEVLYKQVAKAVINGDKKLNLEAAGCYQKPQYTSSSKEIVSVRDKLNKYVSAKITYTFGKRTEVVDGSIINTWLYINENYEIFFDEAKVRTYVDMLADKYDTIGKTRTFVASSGKTIQVSGGSYGWKINRYEEVYDLIEVIKEGRTTTKEPLYMQVAAINDVNDTGNTYVEIDLTKQHLWFYKNGSLVVEGDVVTGDISKNYATPPGTYYLYYKQRDTILRGPDYEAPVSYWMPFNGGIGIHDATWRSAFGGNIYLYDGSHGCINTPYYVAETIFYNIEPGTPIICHY